jgi:hypothetical protein
MEYYRIVVGCILGGSIIGIFASLIRAEISDKGIISMAERSSIRENSKDRGRLNKMKKSIDRDRRSML